MEQDAVDVFGSESSDKSLFEEEDKEPEKPPPVIFQRMKKDCEQKQGTKACMH